MQISASHKHARISAQKVRLVADLIRGKKVEVAVNELMFTNKSSAHYVKKVLDSAIANAENNYAMDIDDLIVSNVQIDNGPTLKRIRARAKGRANRILKRSCHISVVVSNVEKL